MTYLIDALIGATVGLLLVGLDTSLTHYLRRKKVDRVVRAVMLLHPARPTRPRTPDRHPRPARNPPIPHPLADPLITSTST